MTKEELKQEAEEWLCNNLHSASEEDFIKAMVDIAEPREKRIEELEQENKVLSQNLEDTEIVNKALEKENAELKSENQKWKDEWQEQVQKATDEGYARTVQTMQLTKAKELLERLLITSCNSDVLNLLPNCSEVLRVRVEAEQFLKE